MPTLEFLDRIATRLDRVDRKSLEQYLLETRKEFRFLRNLLDEIPDGIMVLTPKMEIEFTNRRMAQLFNIPDTDSSKLTLKQAISDVSFAQLISNAIDDGEEVFQKEFEVLLPRPMLIRFNLTFDDKKMPSRSVVTITNLTQAETNIRERFRIENWETMLVLAAGIAHEIGNPLNSLMIHLTLLTKALPMLPPAERKKIEKSIEVMQDETKRLDQIVRNFLKATRRKPLKFELLQINDIISKTLDLLSPELKSSKIKSTQRLDDRLPPFLLDPERIHQVFVNIIKNAIHAMPQGGTLAIKSESRGKLCLVHFQDSGIGIPENKLPKIFDAYYTTKEEGTGLGLMIVYQIIREHGGRIEVVSKPNSGTTFTCIFPIRSQKLSLPAPAKREK